MSISKPFSYSPIPMKKWKIRKMRQADKDIQDKARQEEEEPFEADEDNL
jgi:hypothetical protein